MTHHERRLAAKARERETGRPRVSWRRVSDDTGGGYSGYGPDGLDRLVYIRRVGEGRSGEWEYGTIEGKRRIRRGSDVLLLVAKDQAERLFSRGNDNEEEQ